MYRCFYYIAIIFLLEQSWKPPKKRRLRLRRRGPAAVRAQGLAGRVVEVVVVIVVLALHKDKMRHERTKLLPL